MDRYESVSKLPATEVLHMQPDTNYARTRTALAQAVQAPPLRRPSSCLIHTTIGRLRETTGWSCRLATFHSNWPIKKAYQFQRMFNLQFESALPKVHFS